MIRAVFILALIVACASAFVTPANHAGEFLWIDFVENEKAVSDRSIRAFNGVMTHICLYS